MTKPSQTEAPKASLALRTRLLCPALALAIGAVGACGKKNEDPPPTGERTKEPVPETPKDALTGPFAGFDFEGAQAKWQGSWVVGGSSIGQRAAWMLHGEELVEFDGERELRTRFAVYSPCQVSRTDEDEGETTYTTFAFAEEGVLHAGLGAAGVIVGDTTIACTGGKVYTLADGTCLEWSEMFDDWTSEPAECRIEGEGEERRFVVGSTKLRFIGDGRALVDDQMAKNVAEKHPNFEAAKAALARDAG